MNTILSETANHAVEQALELSSLMVRAGQAPEALWLLEESVQSFPDHDGLKVQLGRTALVIGNPVRARAAVEAIGAESREHPDALLVRAHAELALGDLEPALDLLATAQKLYPDSRPVLATRIGTLLREKRFDEADGHAKAALRLAKPLEHRMTVFRAEWLRHRLVKLRNPEESDRHRMAYVRKLFMLLDRHEGIEEVLEFKQTVMRATEVQDRKKP